MQKVVFFFLPVIFLFTVSFSRPSSNKINWLTVAEFEAAYAKQPKPILVDLYTDWCGWCKVMDKDTYSKEKVVEYINTNYYAIKYNAESRDSVAFNGKKYAYNSRYKANDLAVYLSFGNLSFPTTVFLADINAQPAPIPGFLKTSEIEAPLKYFGDGAYKTKTFPEFMKGFSRSW